MEENKNTQDNTLELSCGNSKIVVNSDGIRLNGDVIKLNNVDEVDVNEFR